MRRIALVATPELLVASLFLPAIAVADDELDALIRDEIESSKKFATRVNGVKLDATVEVVQSKEGEKKDRQKTVHIQRKLLFHWTLDYDGPRQPLIILTPSLTLPTNRQTRIDFHAFGADSNNVVESFSSVWLRDAVRIDPSFFTTVPMGKKGTGTIEISAAALQETLRKDRVTRLVPYPPRVILARLRHEPNVRGRDDNLDAWTGFVQTKLFRIAFTELANEP